MRSGSEQYALPIEAARSLPIGELVLSEARLRLPGAFLLANLVFLKLSDLTLPPAEGVGERRSVHTTD